MGHVGKRARGTPKEELRENLASGSGVRERWSKDLAMGSVSDRVLAWAAGEDIRLVEDEAAPWSLPVCSGFDMDKMFDCIHSAARNASLESDAAMQRSLNY